MQMQIHPPIYRTNSTAIAIGETATTTAAAMDRKTVERNRRIKMKHLCTKLESLIPNSRKAASQAEQLEAAAAYIAEMRGRLQRLRERKARLESPAPVTDARYPIVEIRDLGACFEVILVSKSGKSLMLSQVVGVLEDEGAEVIGVNVAAVGDKVHQTVHAEAKCPRVGVKTAMLGGRLHQLISSDTGHLYN